MNRRYHPNPRMDIPISLEVWHQLLGASTNSKFEKEDWEIAAEAIEEWMRRHAPDSLASPVAGGYQWKRLFLPTGTLLRTVFNAKNHHCMVEGDQILYQGQSVSPSGFVNAVGGIRRNAWRCTWIRLPDANQWQLADTLRTRESPRRTRKPVAPGGMAKAALPPNCRGSSHAPACAPATASAPTTATATAPASTSAVVSESAPSSTQAGAHATAAAASAPKSEANDKIDGTEATESIEATAVQYTHAPKPPRLRRSFDKPAHATSAGAQGDPSEPRTRPGVTLPAPPYSGHRPRGAERRTAADATIAALLQQELLALLYRIGSIGALSSATLPASTISPPTPPAAAGTDP